MVSQSVAFLSFSTGPAHGRCLGPVCAGRVCLPVDGDHAGPLFACARICWRDSCRHIAKNQCPLLGGACCVDACELLTLIRTHPAFPLCGLSGDPTDAAFPGCRCVAGVACALLIFVAKSWSFGAVGKTADICQAHVWHGSVGMAILRRLWRVHWCTAALVGS